MGVTPVLVLLLHLRCAYDIVTLYGLAWEEGPSWGDAVTFCMSGADPPDATVCEGILSFTYWEFPTNQLHWRSLRKLGIAKTAALLF